MSNDRGNYDEDFFAQEALMSLYNHLGLASRIFMGYDREYSSHEAGTTIKIRGPGSFTAGNAPTATASAQDILTRSVSVTLDQWKDVVFGLTDKEMALSKEEILRDHVDPAAAAIAEVIDTYILANYYKVPWAFAQAGATAAVVDVVEARRLLQVSKCPINDRANMHFMLTTTHEKDLLNIAAFSQHQGGDGTAVNTQLSGNLGMRYGFNFWANQNVTSHTASTTTDVAGAVDSGNGGYSKGDSTMTIDALASADIIRKGDTFAIAGNTQRYALTADVQLASNEGSFTFTPALVVDAAEDAVVTFQTKTADEFPSGNFSLGFHRNWYALAFGRLPATTISGLGAKVSTVSDPITGLSLRVTMWYDGNLAKTMVRVDALYGGEVLDNNMAVRFHESVT